jgi:hypothetical protein
MSNSGSQDRIRELAIKQFQEYAAYDRTLDALAAIRVVLNTPEIQGELLSYDFHPRIQRAGDFPTPHLTPDGLILLKGQRNFLLEMKTSWNDSDISQACKYAHSPAWIKADGTPVPFGTQPCILLGYQKQVGQGNLDRLFKDFKAQTNAALVVFHYALETGTEHLMYFSRLAHPENGRCPESEFGKLFNYAGFPVRASDFKYLRSKFDKANDEVIDSYAAVIWWSKYAVHYLTETQKTEMAEKGSLSEPLKIAPDRICDVPRPEGTEIGLDSDDVRRALEFLRQARLVTKTRKGGYEIPLKTNIRLPLDAPEVTGKHLNEITDKVILRWATYKVLKPIKEKKQTPRKHRARSRRDTRTLSLFDKS